MVFVDVAVEESRARAFGRGRLLYFSLAVRWQLQAFRLGPKDLSVRMESDSQGRRIEGFV